MEEDAQSLALRKREIDAGKDELFQAETGGSAAVTAARLHDRERHQDRPRPRGHLVQHIAGEHHDLGRHRGHVPSRVESEEAEVDLDVAVGSLQAAERENARAGAAQRVAIDGQAGEFQRAVRLHRGADFGWTAGVDVEAAIGQLAVENRAGGAFDARAAGRIPLGAIRLVQPKLQQDVVALEGGIGGEFSAPETVSGLLGGECGNGPLDD